MAGRLELAQRLAESNGMPWSNAPVATIDAWLADLDAVAVELGGTRGTPDLRLWGLDRDAIRERQTAVVARARRRAGYKAVEAKYGPAVAKNIVNRARAAR